MRFHASSGIFFLWMFFSCSLIAMEEREDYGNPLIWIAELIAYEKRGSSEYDTYFTKVISEITTKTSQEQLELYLVILENAALQDAHNTVKKIYSLIEDLYYNFSGDQLLARKAIHIVAQLLYEKKPYAELDALARLGSNTETPLDQECNSEKENPKTSNNTLLFKYNDALDLMQCLLEQNDDYSFSLAFQEFAKQFTDQDPREQFTTMRALTEQSNSSHPRIAKHFYKHLTKIYELYFRETPEGKNYYFSIKELDKSINPNSVHTLPLSTVIRNSTAARTHARSNKNNTRPPYSALFNKVAWETPWSIQPERKIVCYALINQLLIIASANSAITMYNLLTGDPVYESTQNDHQAKPCYIANGIVDFQDTNFTSKVLTLDSEQKITILSSDGSRPQCLLSENRIYFIRAYDNGKICVDFLPNKEKKATFLAHRNKITGLHLVGKNKQKLLTSSLDGDIKIWHLGKVLDHPHDAGEHVKLLNIDTANNNKPITALTMFNGMPISIRGNHLVELWDRSKKKSMIFHNEEKKQFDTIASFDDYLVYNVHNRLRVFHKDLGLHKHTSIPIGESRVTSITVSDNKQDLLVYTENNLLNIYSLITARKKLLREDYDDDIIIDIKP